MPVNDRSQLIIASSITTAACMSDPFLRRDPWPPQRKRLPLSSEVRTTVLLSCPSAVSGGPYFTERLLFLALLPASIQTTPITRPGRTGGFSEMPVQTTERSRMPPADSSTGPSHLASATWTGANCSWEPSARQRGPQQPVPIHIPGICQTDFMFRVCTCRC